MSTRIIVVAAAGLVLAAVGIYGFWRAGVPDPKPVVQASATGDLVYRMGGYSVRLLEKPCAFPDLVESLQAEGAFGDAKAAVIVERDRRYSGCWSRSVDEALLQDLSGHGGQLPLSWFKREPQI